MTNVPTVSIIIPCYNREKYLGFAIQSVLAQTYTDIELIVVDDGSTDGSLEIAQNYAAQDLRIKLLNTVRPAKDKYRGAVNALITGFNAAQGEYVGSVDSDDILECPALELTVEALETHPEWGMVYTNYVDINESGKKLRTGWRCSIPYSADKLLTSFMTFHFRLIRKKVYQAVGGFDVKADRIEDYDLCLRISEQYEIGKINEFLYQYRQHFNSLMYSKNISIIVLMEKVIKAAIKRRGMTDTHRLNLALNPQFTIEEI